MHYCEYIYYYNCFFTIVDSNCWLFLLFDDKFSSDCEVQFLYVFFYPQGDKCQIN